MSDVPALDALGREMGAALRRELPALRRRRRAAALAGVLAVAVAVPAAGSATEWAGLAGGQTALPTQVRDGLRLQLQAGRDERGPWRLEIYRAKLAGSGGKVGLCVFVSREGGGTGRCLPSARVGRLVDAGQDAMVGVAAGVVRGPVARVEVTLERYDRIGRRVVAAIPAPSPSGALAARGLPEDLRPFAVVARGDETTVGGLRALDADGTTIATSGRPAPSAPRLEAVPSPVPTADPRP